MTRYTDVEIARRYLNKVSDCSKRKMDFDLPFSVFKRIMNTQKCYYTGTVLDNTMGPFGVTIDRVDCKVGYVVGNVVACANFANSAKNDIFENSGFGVEHTKKMIAKIEKHLAKYGSNE